MSQFEIELNAEPTAIKKAVKGLEKQRREVPKIRLAYEGFIKELPKIPLTKFEKMKLKKSAQELLPYILVEFADRPKERSKLFALIKAKFSKCSVRTRFRILAYGLSYPEIRKVGYLHYSNNPPKENAPRWIRDHWKKILRPEDPTQQFVEILKVNKIPIVHLVSWLELNPCVPIIDSLLQGYLSHHPHDVLRKCSFWDVYRFLQSSAPSNVRHIILVWVLNTYANSWSTLDDIPKGYQQVLTYAIHEWGIPTRGFWKECQPKVLEAVLWLSQREQKP